MLVKHSVAAYDLCHADPTYVSLLDARPLTCQNAWQSLSRQVNQVVEGDSITQTSPPATIAADSGSTGVMTGALAYKFGSLSTTAPTGAVSSQLLYSFTAWHPSRLQEAKSRSPPHPPPSLPAPPRPPSSLSLSLSLILLHLREGTRQAGGRVTNEGD